MSYQLTSEQYSNVLPVEKDGKFLLRSDNVEWCHYIFNSFEDAIKQRDIRVSWIKHHEETTKRLIAEKEAQDKKEYELKCSYGTFFIGMTPIRMGKARKTLETVISCNGVITTRKEKLEKCALEGWKVTTWQGEKVLRKDDCIRDINLTEEKYFNYLLAKTE
jgi:hypothetical protein